MSEALGSLEKVLRVGEGRRLKRLRSQADYITSLEPDFEKLSDAELSGKTAEFRQRIENGEPVDELGFDSLRDNMAVTLDGVVQRGHDYAIVDEVDSILVDEARTPLIISGEPEVAAQVYYDFARIARTLEGYAAKPGDPKGAAEASGADFEYDEKHKTVSPMQGSIERVERTLRIDNLYDPRNSQLVNHLNQALKAEALFHRDVDYGGQDGEVKSVDEFTGRIMERPRWSDGLHQAVEAKEGAGQRGAVTIATNMAGRGVDIKLGEGIVDLGGLYVLGTERHEARRIDNQLRGRSGRQGDPGESRFYLSGQDELVRLFAGDRIYGIMERFKVPDDQPMEAGILSRQIENAQKKVEEQNFVMRKNVLKYDDVLNRHRGRIYEQRRQVLEGEDMSEQVKLWIDEVVEDTVAQFTEEAYAEEWDLEALTNAMAALYPTEITAAELREDLGDVTRDALIEEFQADARDEYAAKEEEFGAELMREPERFVILQVVDVRWREHLEHLDYLREGIGLRAMAQKDPR